MRVRGLACVRCGDKGNTSNAVVVADDDAAYDLLAERLPAELDDLAEGPVERYDLPQVNAFNFVVENALAGGVTRSPRMDGHGKSLSCASWASTSTRSRGCSPFRSLGCSALSAPRRL